MCPLARIKLLHRRHRAQNAAGYVDIDAILARFRSAGGLKHDFQPYELFLPRQLLERDRRISMLDLGSGSSTAVFVAHIREHGGRLCSVDESDLWLANTIKLAGIEADDRRKDAINDDIFRIADAYPPRMIAVDGRYATMRALEKRLQGRYEVEPSAH